MFSLGGGAHTLIRKGSKVTLTRSRSGSSKGTPKHSDPKDQQFPKKWTPGKKHARALSAKAVEAKKRARADSEPSNTDSCQQKLVDGGIRRASGPDPRAVSPTDDVFELPSTSPRGQSTTRPRHVPIVVPVYGSGACEPSVPRKDSLATSLLSDSGSSCDSDPQPATPGLPPSPQHRGKARHVEIQIPHWAQPIPPRLAITQSTFIDPFADSTLLSSPDMSRPPPYGDRNPDGPNASPSRLYVNHSNSGSHVGLASAYSSQTSLVGMRAEYESASEADSTQDEREGGSNTRSRAAGSSSHNAPASTQTTPSGTNTSHLSGLVCNVHRTTGKEPQPLVGATTTILGDKLYVFGGRRLARTKPQHTAKLYELDLIHRHWTKLEVKGDIPPPRYFHSVCALGDSKLVCYGGMSPSQTADAGPDGQNEVTVMSDIHIFDVPTKTWTKLNPADPPQGRYAHCAAILPSGAVFASSTAPLSAIHKNLSSGAPNQGTLGANIDGSGGAEMIVVGGQDKANHYIEQISVFNLRSLKWTGTTGMGRSCGAYRSVVTPLTTMEASQVGAGPHAPQDLDDDDEEPSTVLSGAPLLIYSNYNFLDVKLELQVRLPDGTLTEKPMQTGVSPPGLRFPNGGVIDKHFVVSGTFLTSSKQEYALWALDLRTLTWSRIDAGGSIFSQGSWNRGVLWSRRNSFVILGNRKRSLVDDYNNRRINFSNMCVVELEAFGLYDNPRSTEPTSDYVSASALSQPSNDPFCSAGRHLSYAAEELGTLALGVRELTDMDFLAIDGTRIPVSSRLVARRWGPHFTNILKESLVAASETDTATLRPSVNSHPSRNSSITITGSVSSGVSNATTLINSKTAEPPDSRSAPPASRPRLLYLPHTAPTLQALLHYLYTSTLPSAPSPLATPQIFCSLLQLARPYKIDGLLEAVAERLHESLDGKLTLPCTVNCSLTHSQQAKTLRRSSTQQPWQLVVARACSSPPLTMGPEKA